MWIQACLCWLKVWKKSLPSDAFVTAKPWCRCNNSNKGCFLFLFRDLVLLSKPKSLCQHALSTLGGLMIVQQNLSSVDKVKAFFRMCKGGKWDCNLTKPNCHFTMANHYNCKKDKLSFYYDQQDQSKQQWEQQRSKVSCKVWDFSSYRFCLWKEEILV